MSKGDLLEQPSLHEQEEYFRRILKELQLEGIVSVGKSKVCPGKGNYDYSKFIRIF
jgi:CRP-like cAMP-binding protein